MYRNWLDCVKKVYANEGGIRAFYKGVLPQLVGVAPEKVRSRVLSSFLFLVTGLALTNFVTYLGFKTHGQRLDSK